MATTLTWHGHSTFTLETSSGVRIAVDPWFTGNPVADRTLEAVAPVDWIFCTHGHQDHFGDAIALAQRDGATLVASFELAMFAASKGVERIHPMGVGGSFAFPFGRVKMIPAIHGGQVHGDTTGQWTCTPGGFLFSLDDVRIYHAGDTALFSDMALIAGQVDVALLPIGDNFTMGPEDAARAVEFLRPSVVIPMHYNTFELIRQDPEFFRSAVGDRAKVDVMEPGGVRTFGRP
jgi:L-ascorbate metabolism protein UlaG (beta-lactamase superfamily)